MAQHDIEMTDPEAGDAVGDARTNPLRREIEVTRAVAPDLGAHDVAIARHARKCATEHDLCVAVVRRHVEERDAALERLVHGRDRLGLVDRAERATEGRATEAELRDDQAGAAERSRVHADTPRTVSRYGFSSTPRGSRRARSARKSSKRGYSGRSDAAC